MLECITNKSATPGSTPVAFSLLASITLRFPPFGIAKKVTFSGDGYDTEKMQKTLSHLDKLTSEYPMQAVSINEVKFKSGVGKFGSVSYSTLRNEVAVFNVGNRKDSLKNRTYNSEDFAKNFKRYKSVVDEENNDLTTTMHEFAHLITTQSRGGKTDDISCPGIQRSQDLVDL